MSKESKITPSGQRQALYELNLPEALRDFISVSPDDPHWQAVQRWGHSHGISQEAMNELLSLHFEAEMAKLQAVQGTQGVANTPSQPLDIQALKTGQEAKEEAKEEDRLVQLLGRDHQRQRQSIARWVMGLMGDLFKQNQGLRSAAEELASRADGVMLLKALMERIGERPLPQGQEASIQGLSLESLRRLQASDAYRKGEPLARRQVREGYQQLYG